jgi:hypothetical protein
MVLVSLLFVLLCFGEASGTAGNFRQDGYAAGVNRISRLAGIHRFYAGIGRQSNHEVTIGCHRHRMRVAGRCSHSVTGDQLFYLHSDHKNQIGSRLLRQLNHGNLLLLPIVLRLSSFIKVIDSLKASRTEG